MANNVKREPSSPWWKITHAASDASERALRSALRTSIRDLDVNPRDLVEAIKRNRPAQAADAFDWKDFEERMTTKLGKPMERAAVRAARESAERLGIEVDLDDVRARARRQAKASAKLIAKESRRAVRDAAKAYRKLDMPAPMVASRLREIAGLNRSQAVAVVNREKGLVAEGASFSKRRRLAKRTANGYKRARMGLIARNEGLDAAEAAQSRVVENAADEGAIDDAEQRWVDVRDENVCQICRRLHGQRVKVGESFVDPGTGIKYDGPPAHGRCRCGRQYFYRKQNRRRAA